MIHVYRPFLTDDLVCTAARHGVPLAFEHCVIEDKGTMRLSIVIPQAWLPGPIGVSHVHSIVPVPSKSLRVRCSNPHRILKSRDDVGQKLLLPFVGYCDDLSAGPPTDVLRTGEFHHRLTMIIGHDFEALLSEELPAMATGGFLSGGESWQ